MSGALVLAGLFVLYLANRRKGAARWVLAGVVAVGVGVGTFQAATAFYAAGGMAGAAGAVKVTR